MTILKIDFLIKSHFYYQYIAKWFGQQLNSLYKIIMCLVDAHKRMFHVFDDISKVEYGSEGVCRRFVAKWKIITNQGRDETSICYIETE